MSVQRNQSHNPLVDGSNPSGPTFCGRVEERATCLQARLQAISAPEGIRLIATCG